MGGPWHGRRRGGRGGGGGEEPVAGIVPFAALERLPNAIANALRAMGQPHAVADLADFAWEWLAADAAYKRELLIFCATPFTFCNAVAKARDADISRGVYRG